MLFYVIIPLCIFVNFFLSCILYFFFFFQAEDGIRDIGVTGVQTCALPIFAVLGEAVPVGGRVSGRPGGTHAVEQLVQRRVRALLDDRHRASSSARSGWVGARPEARTAPTRSARARSRLAHTSSSSVARDRNVSTASTCSRVIPAMRRSGSGPSSAKTAATSSTRSGTGRSSCRRPSAGS